MKSYNQVTLIGRSTKDAEVKTIEVIRDGQKEGTFRTTFTLAVDRRYKKNNETVTDFIPIVLWGKMGEHSGNMIKKGDLVQIAGELNINISDNKNGDTTYRQYFTEIKAVGFLMLSAKNESQK